MSLDCAIHVLQNEQADGPEPEPTGDRGVYRCASFSVHGAKYRVDVLANNGAGWCECIDFATRRQPNLDAGMTTLTEETTCIHLRKVHRFFNRRLFAAMCQEESARR
jgi:hypothetical protein